MQSLDSQNFILIALLTILMTGSGSVAAPLKSEDVLGFEVLVASSCEKGFQCAFGHSLIRVNRKSGIASEDIVLGFSTSAPEPETLSEKISFSIKSVTGLPLTFEVTDLKTVYSNYSLRERRNILRLPLQVTKENKDVLIRNINRLFFPDGEEPDMAMVAKKQTAYNSLFNNCAGEIVSLLNESGFPKELFGVALPSNLPAHLYRTYVSLYPGIMTELNGGLESQFASLPDAFYQLCTTLECATSVVSSFQNYWPGKQIEFPNYERPETGSSRETQGLWVRSEPTHWNSRKPAIQRHFKLLSNAQASEL